MRESHRADELGLKVRRDGDLDVLNEIGDMLGLGPEVAVDQGDPRAVAGRVSNRGDFAQIAVRDHSDYHSVLRTDEATEGPG